MVSAYSFPAQIDVVQRRIELRVEYATGAVFTGARAGLDALSAHLACERDLETQADGVTVRMFRDGVPFVAFQFASEQDGRACAEHERMRLLRDRWAH